MKISNTLSDCDLSTELLRSQREENFCTEFHRAKLRFCICNESERMNEEERKLDEIIYKICGENVVEIGGHVKNAALFFRIVFRADYLQISQDVKNNFYETVCMEFIFSDVIGEIVEQIDELDLIPHVKIDIFKATLKILNIKAITNKHCLTLKYIHRRNRHNQINFENIDEMVITPCAYKIMFTRSGVNLHHLNLIIKLFKIKKLTLDGCNLNWNSEGNPLNNLNLSHLYISECGTSVNRIIRENFEALRDSLRVLDISGCPLYKETLMIIREFRLTRLSMRNCVKKRGYFIENLWSEAFKFGSYVKSDIKIDLLWEEGILKDTLRYLDISANDLVHEELNKIMELHLRELNLSRTYSKLDTQFMSENNLNFPYCLRKLILIDVVIDFIVFSTLCNFCFQRLEVSYDAAKEFKDYSLLLKKPIIESLEELNLDLKNHCQSFVSFISHFKLKYFECKLGTWYYYDFDSFWRNNNRKYLEVLILEDGKISENDAEGISQLKLKILSIHPFLFDTKRHILKILSSENLCNSILDLRLGGAYEVDNDHLTLITNFENLEYLSLKISGINLTKQLLKKLELLSALKSLRLKVYIGLNINEEVASILCNFPAKTELTIHLIGVGKHWCLSFTENAFHELLKNTANIQYTEYPVRLEFSNCILNKRCADVFKHFNVEYVTFSFCVFDHFLEEFLKEEMLFTLQDLTLKRVDIDEKQLEVLANIPLTKLSILTSNEFTYINLPKILNSGNISNSLSTLSIGPSACIHFIEEISNMKLSVCELYSCD